MSSATVHPSQMRGLLTYQDPQVVIRREEILKEVTAIAHFGR